MKKYKVKAKGKSQEELRELKDSIVKKINQYTKEVGQIQCIVGSKFTLDFLGKPLTGHSTLNLNAPVNSFNIGITVNLAVKDSNDFLVSAGYFNAAYIESMDDSEIILLSTKGNAVIEIQLGD